MQRDDRLSWLPRVVLWPLAVLSIIFGPLLFFFPVQTDTLFAWTIQPNMSAVFVGASYIFGGVATINLLRAGRWHPLRMGLAGTWAFSTAQFAATVMHWDRFHHGSILFYGWLVIYAVLPLGLPIAYWLNDKRRAQAQPGELHLARPVQLGLTVAGIAYTLIGLWMFFFPAAAAAVWPWRLTPLMSRIIGGWFLLPGVAAALAYREPRYTAFRTLLRDDILWPLLLFVGAVMQRGDFDFSRPLAPFWFAFMGLSTLVVAGVWWYHERLYRERQAAEVTVGTAVAGR